MMGDFLVVQQLRIHLREQATVHGVTEESDTTYQLNNNNNEKIKCEVTGLRAHPSGSTHLPGLW